jgi:long-subunit fatty acid transport protein
LSFACDANAHAVINAGRNGNLQDNFLGSLWGLDAVQHYFPNPYLEYRIASIVGVGVSYDELKARTLDWANADQTATAGDGDLQIRGLNLYVVARIRTRSRFEPYAQVGYGWYQSQFFVAPGWAAPGRRFEVEDTQGWLGALGCKAAIGKHLGVDAGFCHAQLDDVAARAYLGVGNRYRAGEFPMRYDALTLGMQYTF